MPSRWTGDLVLVADHAAGLQIINITNPASPILAGTYNTPGWAYGVAVDGDLAFVGDWDAGLQIINITNPASPTLAGTYNTTGSAYGVAVAGDLVFVADVWSGLQIISITNPGSPTLTGTYDTPGNAFGIAVEGDLAFVADVESGLQVIDITSPASPILIGSYDTESATEVAVAGDLAFVADNDAGLQIVHVSTPASPILAGTYNTPGNAFGIAVEGDLAFVADLYTGLQIISITNPASPTLAGTYDTPGAANGVAVAGDLAFVADVDAGLQIVNITNPASPILAGTYNTPGSAYGVAVAGDLAFVADSGAGLQIISITNPASPTLAGTYNTPGYAYGVAVAGDLAFVADVDAGLQIVNITNPASPTLAGTYNTPGYAYVVAVAGDLAFVADGDAGLQIINITNPASPTLAGTYNTPGYAYGVAVAGDLAFVADDLAGLQIINVTNPASPTLAGTYSTPDHAEGVAVAGDLAFVANYLAGLQAIKVYSHEFHTLDNIGRSLAIDGSNETTVRARLSSTQTTGVSWELSADAGSNWQAFTPNNTWNTLANPGSDLLWRSTHTWSLAAPGLNPTVSDLQIEWRYNSATSVAITDIPGDQGGWVRLKILRSGLDFTEEASLPIVHYGVWRRVDDAALATALASVLRTGASIEPSVAEAFGALPVFGYDDRVFVQSAPGQATAGFPPGAWELVQTIPALQQDVYLASIPTEADSTVQGMHHTVLVTTAHTTTPSVWYASPPDSGHSVDNIAPAVPANFAIAYNTGSGNTLSWNPSPDVDFQYFRVYRSTDPNFMPSPGTLVHSTTSTGWADPDGGPIYYKVTALDYAGNESDPAAAGSVTAVELPAVPHSFALYPNVPNPFNPTTLIRYDVPEHGGAVSIRIYEASGRLVRALVDGAQSPGAKVVSWDGRDDDGRPVASGVYFYRLEASNYTKTRKMVLLK